jgi:predicted RNase H-like HicB family nuclease
LDVSARVTPEEVLRLREYLSVPYLLEAETVEVAPGSWIRRVSYPELPGCTAQSLVVEDALQTLERMRIEMIIAMIGKGQPPPIPRSPLQNCDPAWVARQAGLSGDIITLIDRDGASATDANDRPPERNADALAPR